MKAYLPIALLGFAYAASVCAREIEDPQLQGNRHYEIQVKFSAAQADALQLAVQLGAALGTELVEWRGMTEIAGSIERGREVQVYVLHRHARHFDITMEVSPHPYPDFLSAPGVSYRVERKRVVGTGTYLALGMPPYPGGHDFIPPGDTSMRPAPDYMEESRRRAQWNVYKITADLWKEQYHEPLPPIEAEVRDAAGRLTLVKSPRSDVMIDIRNQINGLEKQIDELERDVQGQIDTFSFATTDPGVLQLKRDQQAVKARLPALRDAIQIVGGMGGAQALSREDARFYRVLQALSQQLKNRTLAYQHQIDQEREAQRKRQQEEERRMRAIRRLGWDYLASVVGAACADPVQAATMNDAGRITGVELSHTDFSSFLIHDTSTRNDLVGIVTGESRPKLDACQGAVLGSMLDQRQAVSMAEVIRRAQAWRTAHPTVGERIGRSFEAMGKSLDNLLTALAESTRSIGYSWGGGSGSGSGVRRDRDSSGIGGGSSHGPTIDLRPPDFGPGSTLGR
jgi:uncharacterized membrane protein YgcG